MPMLPPPRIHRPGTTPAKATNPRPARVMMKSSSPVIEEIALKTELSGGAGTNAARHILTLSKTVGFNTHQVKELADEGLFCQIQPPFSPFGKTWSELYRIFKGCDGNARLTTLSVRAGLAPREIKEIYRRGDLNEDSLRAMISLRGSN